MTSTCIYTEPISFNKKSERPSETLMINKLYQHFLEHVGLSSFDAVWSFSRGKVIKVKGERTVIRVHFSRAIAHETGPDPVPGKETVFYIKKHSQHLSLWQKLRSVLHPALTCCGEGVKEFHNYCQFRYNGLATAIPVAAGIKFTSFFKADSFLITRDFSPLVSLEDIVLQQPATLLGVDNQQKKQNIMREIARYARRMHDSGMNQKDFNATHILLQDRKTDKPLIALFDLQRVDHNRLNCLRWPVKALAELNFTLPPEIFTEKDRFFLFSAYMGKDILSTLDRWQYILIKQKTEKIARHTKKRGLAPKMTGAE